MKIFYATNKLKMQFSNATEIKKAFGIMAKKVSARKEDIISAATLQVLMQIPPANCHPLTGDMKGEWAVNISGNHRIIFEISHNPIPLKEDTGVDTERVTEITILRTEDYH